MSSALKDAVLAYTEGRPGNDSFYPTAIETLMVMRWDRETTPRCALYRPALCINVQGAKRAMLGDKVLDYAELQYLVVSMDLPIRGRVTCAAPDKPFLAIALEIDVALLREVMEQIGSPRPTPGESGLGVFVGDFTPPLADCALRLMRLLETPQAIPVLYPAIVRELYYWLLTGPDGAAIGRLALPDSHTQRIAKAIHVMREDFAHPVRIERLAAVASMSPSSFHQHFKAVTSMTPLQYQKQLRLLEARRLMTADAANATDAAYQVGYESASQFSREYSRMFGVPPKRDAAQLRAL
jgi:AraC-like DNA-binding protein